MSKKLLIVVLLCFVVLLTVIAYWWWQSDISHNGRLYKDRNKLCQQIAVDYLRNVRNDPDFSEEEWSMAIDIETEIHKLCQLNLIKEDIINYSPSTFNKYTINIADQLRECLPKSDMASKEKCDKLLDSITNYFECVEAGFPIQESYPERCSTPDGRTFVNSIEEPRL